MDNPKRYEKFPKRVLESKPREATPVTGDVFGKICHIGPVRLLFLQALGGAQAFASVSTDTLFAVEAEQCSLCRQIDWRYNDHRAVCKSCHLVRRSKEQRETQMEAYRQYDIDSSRQHRHKQPRKVQASMRRFSNCLKRRRQ